MFDTTDILRRSAVRMGIILQRLSFILVVIATIPLFTAIVSISIYLFIVLVVLCTIFLIFLVKPDFVPNLVKTAESINSITKMIAAIPYLTTFALIFAAVSIPLMFADRSWKKSRSGLIICILNFIFVLITSLICIGVYAGGTNP